MSCQLKETAKLTAETISALQKFFQNDDHSPKQKTNRKKNEEFTSLLEEPPLFEFCEDGYSDKDYSAEKNTGLIEWLNETAGDRSDDTNYEVDHGWLKTCLITASHNLGFLAVAAVQKCVILRETIRVPNTFEPIAWIHIESNEESTNPIYITSVFPLSIASTRSVDFSIIDWTCICLGLSNGNINFYTESGVCIFTEKCSHVSIKTIRFGSSIYPGNQELIALTADNKIVIFEGLSLFTVLKTARNQIAFGEKSLTEISNTLQLNCHCLELDRLKNIHEFVNAGLVKPSSFDQYVNASNSVAGKEANVTRSSLPAYGNYFVCDRKKFGSFLWNHIEVSSSELLSDAFYHLTSQITNSMPSIGLRSFFGLGVSKKDRSTKVWAVDTRTHRIHERSFLLDADRIGERCYLSPAGWSLIAVADSCARVLLVHSKSRRILRIWKGYRNARCGWIESSSNTDMNKNQKFYKSKAKTLFLVIYAPKRGLLEIWSIENGPRVSAFNVDEKGRLLTINSGQRATLLGSSEALSFVSHSNNTTIAFLSSDGTIYTINVPFHLSALDVSASSVHDENFIKEFNISNVLKEDDLSTKRSEELKGVVLNIKKWVTLCKNLKTWLVTRRFIDILLNSNEFCKFDSNENQPKIIPLVDVYAAINKLYDEAQITSKSSCEISPFQYYVINLKISMDIYVKLTKLHSSLELIENKSNELDYEKLRHFLLLSSEEFDSLNLPLLRSNAVTSHQEPYDNFKLLIPLKKFTEQFEFSKESIDQSSDKNKISDTIELKKVDLNFKGLGLLIFGAFVCGVTQSIDDDLNDILLKIDTNIVILTEIFVDFWLDKCNVDPQKLTIESFNVFEFLFKKCKTYNDYCSVIDLVERKVFRSSNIQAALMLCLQLRVLRIRRVEDCKAKCLKIDESQQTQNTDDNCIKNDILKNNCKNNKVFGIFDNNKLAKADLCANNSGNKSSVAVNAADKFLVIDDDDVLVIDDDDVLFSYESNAMGASVEWFDILTQHLSILALFQVLPYENGSQNSLAVNDNCITKNQLTIEQLAHKGFGFYREQIGNWCVKRSPNPQEIAFVLSKKDQPNKRSTNCLLEKTLSLLNALQTKLPMSLRPELTLCDCCWECVTAWYKDESRRVSKLRMAIDFLNILEPAPRLQHGMALTIWTTFILESFQKLYIILNQQDTSGKFDLASKDRLLRRDVLIMESDLAEYINCVRELLRALADSAARLSGGNSPPIVHHSYESFLQRFFVHPKIEGRKSSGMPILSELAAKCKMVNYHLVLHHIHLATTVYLLVNSSISLRPSAFFDSVGQMAFFVNFYSHPLIPLANVDDRTKTRRQLLLEKVVENIGINGVGLNRSTRLKSTNSEKDKDIDSSSQHIQYFSSWNFVMGLARDWKLNVDALRIKEILMLYEFGFDDEAENLMVKVDDKRLLMHSLLPPIAARIKQFFDENVKLTIKVFQCSASSNSTMDYIKNIPEMFSPKFEELNLKAVQRIIYLAKSLAKTKSVTQTSLSLPTQKISMTCGSAVLQQPSTSSFEFNIKLEMLKDFDKICYVIDNYREKKTDTNI